MKRFKIFLFTFLGYFSMMAQEQEKLGTTTLQPQKVALVIGNQNYQYIKPLQNTQNDADDMKIALEKLSFKVTLVKDAGYEQMKTVIVKYLSSLKKNDTAYVYFSGHGINYKRNNYMIPIDMKPLYCGVDISKIAISLEVLTVSLDYTKANVKLIFMDACRNIPALDDCIEKQLGNFSIGFSEPINIPRGTFISFATQEGKVAYEVLSERNSSFTDGLLNFINKPSLTFRTIVDSTTNYVEKKSKYQQIPSRYDELRNDFYLSKKIPPVIDATEIKPVENCKVCKRDKGYFMAKATGIGLSENSSEDNARLNTKALLATSLLEQFKIVFEKYRSENLKNDDGELKEEINKRINDSTQVTLVLYEDDCSSYSTYTNSKGKTIYKSVVCGKIPIEPNLKLFELYLQKSNLPKRFIKEFMTVLKNYLI